MPTSMTGFGRGMSRARKMRFVVEVRSVNSRYCEVNVSAPKGLLEIEHLLQKRVRDLFDRGKFDLVLKVVPDSKGRGSDEEERRLIERWRWLNHLRKRLGLDPPPSLEALLAFEAGGRSESLDDPETAKAFLRAAEMAFDRLKKFRSEEGKTLTADLDRRIRLLEKVVGAIDRKLKQAPRAHADKLRARIGELAGDLHLDRTRLETEIALHADRIDVTEEIVRLKSHLSRLRDLLKTSDGVGRRADFLLQEVNRETNTVGSKAADLGMTSEVLTVKAEVEKIREQVQNLE